MDIVVLFQIAVIIIAFVGGGFVSIHNVTTIFKLQRKHKAIQEVFQDEKIKYERKIRELKTEVNILRADAKRNKI